MNPYVRFMRSPHRRYPASLNHLFKPRIGYIYRADGNIISVPYTVADPACRDGEMLRVPPMSFADVYYTKMLPRIRNDVDQEAAAVYFDPYAGRVVVVGSRALYLDAKNEFFAAGSPLFLENESPFSFDAMAWGALYEPDGADNLTFDDYFTPDVTGVTIADCMLGSSWDDRPEPWRCALSFFDKYCELLLKRASAPGPDPLTDLMARIVAGGNHVLLSMLLLQLPQLLVRFRPTLQEESKFSALRIDGFDTPILNLYHYTLLCGNPDCLSVLFHLYERPKELTEFLRHPLYYSVGHHHIRCGNHAALAFLLTHNSYPDAVDASQGRIPLVACAVKMRRPAMIELLLQAGCDPQKRDTRGVSALDLAAEAGECIALSMLLAAIPEEDAREIATYHAQNLPLSDDNQIVLGILKHYL